MNYFCARQIDPNADRADAGRWRYTCRNGDRIWEVGYCLSTYCSGHRTPEEAEAHQREFDIDMAFLERRWSETEPWDSCARCGRRTPRCYYVGPGMGRPIYLCEEHRTREDLAAVYDGPGQVVSSYSSYGAWMRDEVAHLTADYRGG